MLTEWYQILKYVWDKKFNFLYLSQEFQPVGIGNADG